MAVKALKTTFNQFKGTSVDVPFLEHLNMQQNKIYTLLLGVMCVSNACYADNSLFQGLDNQVAIGYSYSQSKTYNPNYTPLQYTTNSSSLALHIEQLFNNNLWFAADGSFMFQGSQSGPDSGFSQNIQMLGMPASIAGKVGYSFNFPTIGLQIIPYASIGRELNYNGVTIPQNGFVNSYYNYYGGGARAEYVFTPRASVYLDQSMGYLADTGSGSAPNINLDAMSYTTSLGLRYNLFSQFQIAAQANYNYINLLNQSIGYDPITLYHQNTNQSSFGGTLYFAYLFAPNSKDSTNRSSSYSNAANEQLAGFDNNYSIGFGVQRASNSYSGGGQANINSDIGYWNFAITHLFENNVWANLNAQLMNNISQSNVPAGFTNSHVPTDIGFPGNVLVNVGYAFPLSSAPVQFIPYGNAGVVMSINSYNIRQNTSIMNAVSHDMYFQYGLGGRAEYVVIPQIQLYADQLLAGMQDQSPLGINAWRSTSTLGLNYNPWDRLQLGLKGYYDYISPSGQAYSNNTYYALTQSTLGAEFDIGIRY